MRFLKLLLGSALLVAVAAGTAQASVFPIADVEDDKESDSTAAYTRESARGPVLYDVHCRCHGEDEQDATFVDIWCNNNRIGKHQVKGEDEKIDAEQKGKKDELKPSLQVRLVENDVQTYNGSLITDAEGPKGSVAVAFKRKDSSDSTGKGKGTCKFKLDKDDPELSPQPTDPQAETIIELCKSSKTGKVTNGGKVSCRVKGEADFPMF